METITEREVLWEERSFWVHACRIERTGEKTGVLTITLLGYGKIGKDHVIHEQEVDVTRANPDAEQIAKWRKVCAEVIDHPEDWSCGIHG